MIYQARDNGGMNKDEIHVITGLQFLHDVAIDTHFVKRGRIIRMAQIIATNPGCLGLGLEEDTGVVITEGREIEVIGSGVVTVVEARTDTATNIHLVKPGTPFTIRDLHLHILSCGERCILPVQEALHRYNTFSGRQNRLLTTGEGFCLTYSAFLRPEPPGFLPPPSPLFTVAQARASASSFETPLFS